MDKRILSDEELLGIIKKNAGGGGGGTTNYNQLENKPQIAGTTLQGNKTLSDLGIASAQSVSNITNGESINNFAGVETALGNKQGKLTAGSHIDISNNEVSVNRYVNPAGDIVYRAVTVNATTAYVDKYTSGGTFIERINITVNTYQTQDVESKIRFYREFDGWVITLLANSKEHNAGYSYSARTSAGGVESQNDFTFTISQTLDDNDLIIRSELAGKQDALTFDNVPTENSTNPVKSGGVYSALSEKQDVLTAGDYIDITSGEISVNREIPPNNFTYEIVTKSIGNDDASMTVKKYANGSLVSSTDYLYTNVTTAVNIDGYLTLQYANGWKYTLLQASTDHASGYVATWGYQTVVDYTESFPTEDTSGLKLIIKSELDTALETKQDALTAGDYISIANDEISVDREIPSVIAEYEIKTEPMVEGQAFISITKTVNGEVVLTQKYGSSTAGIRQGINFDDNIYVDYSKTADWSWTYKLRNASVDHAKDYVKSWGYGTTVDYTEEFIVTDHSGDKLVIKSEMDTALADKADKADVKNEFIGTLAEWNALTPAQQKAFDTYQITDDYSEALMPNYSTTEQKTGQKWIDGKDIYVKTFNAGALPSSGNVTVQNDIANFGTVINVVTTGISNDGYSFSNGGLVMNYASASSLVFRVTFDATGYNGYVTVYYIKTT